MITCGKVWNYKNALQILRIRKDTQKRKNKRETEIQMQGLRKELSENRWTDQRFYEGQKSSGRDVVHVLESVVQLFGEKDISLFTDDDNELDKESVGRGKNAGNN